MKRWKPAVVVEATRQLGYPESDIVAMGILLLKCTLLYILPRTSVLGAVFLTAYLGGAVASQRQWMVQRGISRDIRCAGLERSVAAGYPRANLTALTESFNWPHLDVSRGSIAKIVVQTISMFYDFHGRPYL